MNLSVLHDDIKKWLAWGIGLPLLLLLILVMLILPLPPLILDLLFTLNIAVSVLILFAGIGSLKPLDFGVFPTVLLLSTLMRLALNIASTRVVLLFGHQGAGAAGEVIKAFGEVVVGGNTVVGFVVFSIFIIINFMVITKGATRISEVSARFILDAMPGKQMAIDADLHAGLTTNEAAQAKRIEITREADFYGAMDGASKFIRGDAAAGLLIVLINWLGGTLIGFFQHKMRIVDALKTYALLSIGDGLAAQIPALILSTAAAMMVTRVSSEQNLGQQIACQVFGNPKSMLCAAGIMLGLGFLPGMPHEPFVFLGLFMGGLGFIFQTEKKKYQEKKQQEKQDTQGLEWKEVSLFDPIVIVLGKGLMSLVKEKEYPFRLALARMRQEHSMEWGFVLPEPLIKENKALQEEAYQLLMLGIVLGEGTVKQEESLNIVNHLSRIIPSKIDRLLDQDIVLQLMDRLAKLCPSLVEDLTPKTLSLSVITQVLRNLLQEQVPIRDLKTIAESLLQHALKTQDPEVLTRFVRIAMGQLIVQKINGSSSEIPVITLSPDLEQLLQKSIQTTQAEYLLIEPKLAEQLRKSIKIIHEKQKAGGQNPIFLVSSPIRKALFQFIHVSLKQIPVLSYDELPADRSVKIVATLGQ